METPFYFFLRGPLPVEVFLLPSQAGSEFPLR